MKKQIIRRTLAFGLILMMLMMPMQAMPVWATGSGSFTLATRSQENGVFYFDAPDVDFGESHLYYDQLTEDAQRDLYHDIQGATPATNVIEFTVTELPDFTIPNEGFTPEFMGRIYAYIEEIILPAYAAASLDAPQLFWSSGVSYGGNLFHNDVEVTALHLQCILDCSPQFDQATYESTAAALVDTLNALSFDESQGTYGLLKQFHDYLCEQTVYVETANSHCIVGPLLDGQSVCEGYAESFKLLCDLAEIPCMIITGVGVTSTGSEPHAWNAVRMEDGKWYAVDVTWDDQESKIYYDFFLVGGDTVPKNFRDISFRQSHVEVNDFYQNGMVIMATPTLNSTAYVPAPAHQHVYSIFIVTPTCEKGGYTKYTCSCGDSYVDNKTAPLGHDFDTVTVDPTCTQAGYCLHTCVRCGHTEKGEEIEALGHDFSDWEMTEPGIETRTCETCGETEAREAQPTFDTNGDGEVTKADAELLMDILVGNADAGDLRCDMDFDGVLTIYDCILILQQIG